jgi:hypothetical protein
LKLGRDAFQKHDVAAEYRATLGLSVELGLELLTRLMVSVVPATDDAVQTDLFDGRDGDPHAATNSRE